MVVAETLLHTDDLAEHLGYSEAEKPIICQLGGCVAENCGKAAAIIAEGVRGEENEGRRRGGVFPEQQEKTVATPTATASSASADKGPFDETRTSSEETLLAYSHLNLNCGCPSDRVSGQGGFGASLMRSPSLVRQIMESVKRKAPGVERSVKCRLGVDEEESFEFLETFIREVSGRDVLAPPSGARSGFSSSRAGRKEEDYDMREEARGGENPSSGKNDLRSPPLAKNENCSPPGGRKEEDYDVRSEGEPPGENPNDSDSTSNEDPASSLTVPTFFLHARKCILAGLTPAQNRSVPPLNYRRIYQMCERFPELSFHLNGGVKCLKEAREIAYGKAVSDMMGRRGMEGATADEARAALEAQQESDGRTRTVDDGRTSGGTSASFLHSHLGLVGENPSTAPPQTIAPPNLHGVMIGRLALENVALLADCDRYFYGDKTNPCRTRRELLDKYIRYLEGLHARQCSFHCEWCQKNDSRDLNQEDPLRQQDPHRPRAKMKNVSGVKIATGVICRSAKPLLGLFHNVPGNRAFRRTIDELTRDMRIRDCGPAFILRKAVQLVFTGDAGEILDREFLRTEEVVREREERAAARERKRTASAGIVEVEEVVLAGGIGGVDGKGKRTQGKVEAEGEAAVMEAGAERDKSVWMEEAKRRKEGS